MGYIMTTSTQQSKAIKMTKSQADQIKILVRLGDSLELAIKTVIDQEKKDAAIYKAAYES